MLGLTDQQVGWIVGFLEGEGSFQLQTYKNGKWAYPSIRAFQVQRWPIEQLQELLGGRINLRPPRSSTHRNGQPCWLWYRNGRDVEEILRTLQPLFSPRRQEQIQRVLDGVKRGRPPKLSYELAQEIRASDEMGTVLAKRYGVAPTLISMVRRGQIWKNPPHTHVPTTIGNPYPARGKTTRLRSRG